MKGYVIKKESKFTKLYFNMKVSINYTEITNWVSNHYRIALTFKRMYIAAVDYQ